MQSLYFLLFAGVQLFLMNCNEDLPNACESIDYDAVFEAQAEQAYCLPNDRRIRVDSLVNALCPCNARCVWAGEILAYVTIDMDGESTSHVIHSEKEDDVIDQLSFKIEEYTFVEECGNSNYSPDVATVSLRIMKE